jgi:hypothetical protein
VVGSTRNAPIFETRPRRLQSWRKRNSSAASRT